MPPTTTNTSVDQVFEALRLLSHSDQPVGVIDLARGMSLATSTAHRLLVTLTDEGFAERDTTGTKYELGHRAHELVHGLVRKFPMQSSAVPFLATLARELGETVSLSLPVGWYAVDMASVEGWREVHAGRFVGRRQLMAASPGGLAMLAGAPDRNVTAYCSWAGGGRVDTGHSRALRRLVKQVRETGHAHLLSDGHGELGFPVVHDGKPVAAITVEGTTPEICLDPSAATLRTCRKVADQFAAYLADHPADARDPFDHVPASQLLAPEG